MPTETAKRLAKERVIYLCQVCGVRPAEEAHHCLYGRRKGVKELDMDYNLQLVCIPCHKYTGAAKTWENRVEFWRWACEFYGRDVMIAWHRNLNFKVKERYEEF